MTASRAALFVATVTLLALSPAHAFNRGLGDAPPEVDRQTPLATVQGFLKAARAGRYLEAAHYLWLEHVPLVDQEVVGPRLARHLRFVFDQQSWVDLSKISKNPEGDPEKRNSDDLGVIPLRKIKIPIRVVRVRSGSEDIWVFDRETVRAIEGLYDTYGPPFGDRLPDWLMANGPADMELWQWLGLVALVVGALGIGWVGERTAVAIGRRMTRFARLAWTVVAVDAMSGVLRLPLIAGVLAAGSPFLLPPPEMRAALDLTERSLVIIACAWFVVRFINQGSHFLRGRLESEGASLRARSLETQITVLRRVLVITIYLVAGALFLLQFETVRSLGVSLLASAGVAGLVIGLAAQRSISTLLAGIQLSITQPIRIGDMVVVEGESGTVEHIRLTFVVIRVWDLRRMVVPINYFLEKPFQNWTKSGSDILGTVSIQVDYTADIEAFRTEVRRILEQEGSTLWDGEIQNVQVTEASERTQTLRVLLSARNSNDNWDLRCLVREQMIRFLRQNPRWFPTQRTLPASVEAAGTNRPKSEPPSVLEPAKDPSPRSEGETIQRPV